MPKNSAVEIPFQTKRLHSALTASALFAALNRETHGSPSHLRGNNLLEGARTRQFPTDVCFLAIRRPFLHAHQWAKVKNSRRNRWHMVANRPSLDAGYSVLTRSGRKPGSSLTGNGAPRERAKASGSLPVGAPWLSMCITFPPITLFPDVVWGRSVGWFHGRSGAFLDL